MIMTKKENIVCTELKRFGDLTSAKGVGRAIKSESQCLKAMWVLAVVGLFAITISNVWNLTREFLLYQTGTKIIEKKIDIAQDKASDFLLCNINPYSTVSLNRTLEEKKLYENLITEWTSTDEQLMSKEFISLTNIKQEMLIGHSGFYQHVGHEEASRLSHSWKNLVISCQVYFLDGVMERSIPCTHGNLRVEKYRHKDYFNCYKIFGGDKKSSRPATGMSFLLYIDNLQEQSDTSALTVQNKGKGAILTLGESGTFLNPNTDGVEILPNYVTTIKFETVHRKRLPKPYGECIDRNSQQRYNDDDTTLDSVSKAYKLPFVYTEEACISACIEYSIIQTCKCQDVGQYGILLHIYRNVSTCGATDQGKDLFLERMQCARKYRSTFRKQCLVKCPPPCKEKRDDKSVTFLEISPGQIMETLRKEKQRSSVPGLYGEEQDEVPDYENLNTSHFAWVYLKRQRTSYFLVEDTEGMTISDWLAKVGGAMNLWSGITVFVFVEILDFVCRLTKRVLSSEIPRGQSEKPEVVNHCECHCSCKTGHIGTNNDTIFQAEDRYTGTYGNINSVFS